MATNALFLEPTLNALADNPLFANSVPGKLLQTSPLGFVDIGARGGAHPVVEPIASMTAVLGFEPDDAARKALQKENEAGSQWALTNFPPVALADKEGVSELHHCAVPTNDSLRPTNEAFTSRYDMVKFLNTGSDQLRTKTLDSVLFGDIDDGINWGEFIKVDTQGTEFEIFEGSRRTLTERTVALITEVSFFEIYKGQKLFSEIEQLLRGCGLSFYGFISMHERSKGQINKQEHLGAERPMMADAVFFKDPLPGGPQSTPLDDRGNAALFTSALLLGYSDFALELALATFAGGDSSEGSGADMRQLIMGMTSQSPEDARQEVQELITRIEANPGQANAEVGGFVDRRRRIWNYEDVLNTPT
jgi:FkbM family methyltransferase